MARKTLTLRGRISAATTKRLIVDDGRLTHGVKVKSFSVLGTGTGDIKATLGMSSKFPILQDFADNRQIAWATYSTGVTGTVRLLDPAHIAITDLYITGTSTLAGEEINYLVVLEPVVISDYEAIIQLTKASAQDDLV